MKLRMPWWTGLLLVITALCGGPIAAGQTSFAVATVRPSGAPVPFERDGKIAITPATVEMQDVTVETCIKWAYGVQRGQIFGPAQLSSEHYDIRAKADGPAKVEEMKLMMRALLADRFKLTFHRETREMRTYALQVAKSDPRLKRVADDGVPSHQNSDIGVTAKALTMKEFADYIAGSLESPVVDMTGLTGRYDFALDFTPYVNQERVEGEPRPDAAAVLNMTMKGEIGLKLEKQKAAVETFVVDHLEGPSAN